MKKKLLLLLLYLTGISMVGQNPTRFPYGVQIKGGQTATSTTSKIISQETDGTLNTIDAVNFPVSTATTNALELETDVSAGAVSGFTLTNNGNGTVNISSGIAYLRATNDPYAPIIKYPIAAVTNLALTDNANNYVLVDYNGGSPTLTVTTNGSTINTQTNSLAFLIARVGNNLDYLSLVGQNVDPNAKLRVRFLNQEGIRRASGAVLGFSNRNLTLTSSVLFSGLIRINAVAFNTASPDTFTLAYNNGSTWTRTTGQTQINNTQYNNAGTLTTMPNNSFRTDYVYLLPNNPSKLYVIMGTTTYSSLTLAKAAPRPSILPVELQAIGLEVGRLFIEKNSATIAEVQSSFANEFTGAPVPEHNSLTGLQGGTTGEYNHLTNAQVTLVNAPKTLQYSYDNGSQITTSTSNGAVTIRRGSAADTDNILVGQNGAGTNTFSVTGSGNITGGKITAIPIDTSLMGVIGTSVSNYGIQGNSTSSIGVVGNSINDIGVSASSDNGLPLKVSTTTGIKLASFVNNGVEKSYINNSGGYVIPAFTSTNALLAGGGSLANPISGTGTTNYLPKWTGTGTQGDSSMQQDASGNITITGGSGASVLKLDKSTGAQLSLSGATGTTNYVSLEATNATNPDLNIYIGGSIRQSISNSGVVKINNLSGSGDRVVSADSNGNLLISTAPTAPTPTAGDNSTKIATTAYVDSAVSAGSGSYVTLTGNQTVSGVKTFFGSGTSQINGISFSNNGTALLSAPLTFTNSSTGAGVYSSNTGGGYGLYNQNTSNGVGINVVNINNGVGISLSNQASGNGELISNSGSGIGLYISNTSSTGGRGLVIDSGSAGTGDLFQGRNNGTITSNLTKQGVMSATSFIASNGTIRLKSYTVATLPAGTQGDTAYVTDATSPTYLGTLTGGGSVVCPVFYNGTAWVSH